MPKPLVATISHDLGKEGAKSRIDESLGRIRSQIAAYVSTVEDEWDGDRLKFRVTAIGQTITGEIEVFEDFVRIVVDLPGILGLLGGTIARRIRQQGTALLEKK